MSEAPAKHKFWDNIVPLKGGLSGPQLAGWTPGPAARTGMGCRILADQMIPVEAGIALAADVYLPRVAGRYPAVIAFSAYSKELQATGAPAGNNETGSPPVFTDRGYAHVIVARRGMGRSGGVAGAYFNDADVVDHAKVVQWAAEQVWCDGQVVLFGTSYFGIVQPQVALRNPGALKGFFTIEMCTDYFRHVVMYGGGPQVDFLSLWMGANFTPFQFALRVPPLVRAVASHIFNSKLKRWWWPQIKKRMSRIMKRFRQNMPTRPTRELFAAMVLDGKTRATSALPPGPSGRLDGITLPFVVIQNPGYLNLHQFGAYDLFENAGTPKNCKWLIIGPATYELPSFHWQLEALAFFDHLLYGAANGYAGQAPVRYWTEGAGEYRCAGDFPVPDGEAVRFYPASNGADRAMHRLLTKPVQSGANHWAAVPYGAIVTPGFDEVANPILGFETSIDRDTEFTGPVTLSLVFSSNEIDSHIVARTGRVARDGTYQLLSMGMIRPACRRIDTARSTATEIAIDIDRPEPLTPGSPVTLRFSLTPQPVVLKMGERLRLDIASRVDLLRSDQSHGHAQFDMQVPPYFARNTIHYGPDTYVEMYQVPDRRRLSLADDGEI
ncbi:CocE/NonD family hydrolase [Bradyrhizobium symbiodeficiens]|uniref:CocE/NonD family hydrolase n=1 Tax=Bradyrhizobium symbiodeficiens TaxID=1404367 RepID=A0A6G9A012_9BRAD|nr:CocE/NonD family hydrolase [Bradyrhizobium symbiodeficiens]QIP05812.1 CocE/NonD family hydrolase [Bradyrhizobium symbiodeficiens]